MPSIELEISEELNNFISQLVKDKKFESVETFIMHSAYWLGELYGFSELDGGKNILSLIKSLMGQPMTKTGKMASDGDMEVKIDIPHMDLIIENYGSSKYMFEDALYTSCVFSRMKKGESPISKEEFNSTLEKMKDAGLLSKLEKDNKIMWKKDS